jgi:hypothetical protein
MRMMRKMRMLMDQLLLHWVSHSVAVAVYFALVPPTRMMMRRRRRRKKRRMQQQMKKKAEVHSIQSQWLQV